MSQLTIDYQDISEICAHCKAGYDESRGSIYQDGKGVSIYLAALHQCSGKRAAHMAIAVKAGYEDFAETSAVALRVVNGGPNFEMLVVDFENSPWINESYLGRMLSRHEVLGGSLKETFFHLADHIVSENPTINEYLATD